MAQRSGPHLMLIAPSCRKAADTAAEDAAKAKAETDRLAIPEFKPIAARIAKNHYALVYRGNEPNNLESKLNICFERAETDGTESIAVFCCHGNKELKGAMRDGSVQEEWLFLTPEGLWSGFDTEVLRTKDGEPSKQQPGNLFPGLRALLEKRKAEESKPVTLILAQCYGKFFAEALKKCIAEKPASGYTLDSNLRVVGLSYGKTYRKYHQDETKPNGKISGFVTHSLLQLWVQANLDTVHHNELTGAEDAEAAAKAAKAAAKAAPSAQATFEVTEAAKAAEAAAEAAAKAAVKADAAAAAAAKAAAEAASKVAEAAAAAAEAVKADADAAAAAKAAAKAVMQAYDAAPAPTSASDEATYDDDGDGDEEDEDD